MIDFVDIYYFLQNEQKAFGSFRFQSRFAKISKLTNYHQ